MHSCFEQLADALRALAVDVVLRQQALVLAQLGRKAVEELRDDLVKPARKIFAQSADADVARKHAEAGDALVDVEQQLALAEAVEHHRDGADFHRVRAEPHEMAVDALQLGEQHANPLHAIRHLETEQLLDRQAVGVRVRLRAQVVHALDERNDLLELLLLGRLLDAGVQIADRRRGRHDRLAVELEHQPQHAVRAGVLRPHVDGHRFGAEFWHVYVRAQGLGLRA